MVVKARFWGAAYFWCWSFERALGCHRWRVLTTRVLHRLPIFKCSLDCTKIPRLAIIGVLLDGGACPCKTAAASGTYGIFRENFRQSVGELAIDACNVGLAHGVTSTLYDPWKTVVSRVMFRSDKF